MIGDRCPGEYRLLKFRKESDTKGRTLTCCVYRDSPFRCRVAISRSYPFSFEPDGTAIIDLPVHLKETTVGPRLLAIAGIDNPRWVIARSWLKSSRVHSCPAIFTGPYGSDKYSRSLSLRSISSASTASSRWCTLVVPIIGASTTSW